MKRCERTRCVYHRDGGNRCEYLGITGHSRLKWHMDRGLSTEPGNCRLYTPGAQRKKNLILTATIKPEKTTGVGTTGKKSARRGRPRSEAAAMKRADAKTQAKMRRQVRAERTLRIIELYNDGLNDTQIADRLGIEREIVCRTRKRLRLRAHRFSVNGQDKKEIWDRLLREGFGCHAVAKATGSAVRSVQKYRDSRGIPPQQQKAITNAERERRQRVLQEIMKEVNNDHRTEGQREVQGDEGEIKA